MILIGAGRLVGKPAGVLFERLGAKVTMLVKGDSLEPTKAADIIISGAGVPGLIKPKMLKQGVVLIDAATSESSGLLVGDAEPSCSAKCSVFTPVPGGVGPIAVACLFENAVTLAQHQNSFGAGLAEQQLLTKHK